jgi:transmembrane sensor
VPTSLAVLDTAIDWHLRLAAGEADANAFNDWLRDPEHARVWTQLQSINQRISGLGRHGRAAITGAAGKRRRTARNAILSLLIPCVLLAVIAERQWPLQHLLADYTTATGEYREIRLQDGTHIALDARSALDVEFNREQRRIELRSGQLLVETAHGDSRPFIVATKEGELRALGTRFVVRRDDDGHTRLTVLASAVEATVSNGDKHMLKAGEEILLDGRGIMATGRATPGADAWTHRMLAVENATLAEVIAELARHTRAHIDVDAQIASLPVTGTFPLHDTDMALAVLASTLPIAQQRDTAWWIRLTARQ